MKPCLEFCSDTMLSHVRRVYTSQSQDRVCDTNMSASALVFAAIETLNCIQIIRNDRDETE